MNQLQHQNEHREIPSSLAVFTCPVNCSSNGKKKGFVRDVRTHRGCMRVQVISVA